VFPLTRSRLCHQKRHARFASCFALFQRKEQPIREGGEIVALGRRQGWLLGGGGRWRSWKWWHGRRRTQALIHVHLELMGSYECRTDGALGRSLDTIGFERLLAFFAVGCSSGSGSGNGSGSSCLSLRACQAGLHVTLQCARIQQLEVAERTGTHGRKKTQVCLLPPKTHARTPRQVFFSPSLSSVFSSSRMSGDLELIHLYPASSTASDEEAPFASSPPPPPPPATAVEVAIAPEPLAAPAVVVAPPARRQPDLLGALCCALFLLGASLLAGYIGYWVVRPRYVTCDAPATFWLAGASTTLDNGACNGTAYTRFALSPTPAPLVTLCGIDVNECRAQGDALALGDVITPQVYVCHEERKDDDDGGLTCSTSDTSHSIGPGGGGVFFGILVFIISACTLGLAAILIYNEVTRAVQT
jgi:hypothetical protein